MGNAEKFDLEKVKELTIQLLITIGEDPYREGLAETPRRVAHFWREFTQWQPGNFDVTFEAVTVDQMVVVTGIRVYSLCEHHLLPFWCDVSVGYIPKEKVIGLSKIARIAHRAAHKLQIQERLVDEIANTLGGVVESENVAVIARGLHMCMVMRGVRTEGYMNTSVMRGVFMTDAKAREEFLSIVRS